MCDVCVAEEALWAGRCRTDKCMAFSQGARITWHDAPAPVKNPKWWRPSRLDKLAVKWRRTVSAAERKAVAERMLNRISHEDRTPTPAVCVRAVGTGAEWKRAKYQIKLSCQPWPTKWQKTDDLAGSMCRYGLDVRWDYVPGPVRDWVLGKRAKPPSERQLIALLPKAKKGEETGRKVIPFGSKAGRTVPSPEGHKAAFRVGYAGVTGKVEGSRS